MKREKMSEEEQEPEPLMVLHLYREDDGSLLVSEQRFHTHTIHLTHARKRVFADFWEMCAAELAFLEDHAHELGWSLTEELAYLRRLAEMGILKRKRRHRQKKKKPKKRKKTSFDE